MEVPVFVFCQTLDPFVGCFPSLTLVISEMSEDFVARLIFVPTHQTSVSHDYFLALGFPWLRQLQITPREFACSNGLHKMRHARGSGVRFFVRLKSPLNGPCQESNQGKPD